MKRNRKTRQRHRGFSMVEMLVVVGIIILLTGLLWPAVMKARKASRQAACAANMRQIAELMMLYAGANEDKVPMGIPAIPSGNGTEVNPNSDSGWKQLPTCYPVIDGVPSAGLGPLIATGMLNQENCKILYCPSDSDERLSWRLWRDKYPLRGQQVAKDNTDIRISYFSRPVVKHLWKHTLLQPPAIQCYWPESMMRYDDLINKATFAECAAWASHGSEADPRINIIKQDGSVHLVMLKHNAKVGQRKPDLPNFLTKPDPYVTDLNPSSNNPGPGAEIMPGLWETLFDRQ